MKVAAIIPAAGQGVRMGSDVPKQFLALNGKAILGHTLDVFRRCDAVDEIVLVLPQDEIEAARRQLLSDAPKVTQVVAGGRQRQDSVRNGFQALSADTDIVVVHDGVRPFVTPEMIGASVTAARECGAVITAVPLSDTIKKVNKEDFVERTVDRDGLWRVQTPQTFQYAVLKDAFARAAADNYYGTDEGSLIEHLGRPLKVITGSELNIKITRTGDLALGEKIAALLERG